MQIDASTVYWLTRLDSIQTLGAVLVVAGLAALAGSIIAGAMMRADPITRGGNEAGVAVHRACRRWIWIFPTLGALVTTFVPTTKEAAAILVIPAIASSEEVQGLGADVIGLAREWVQELKPEPEIKSE